MYNTPKYHKINVRHVPSCAHAIVDRFRIDEMPEEHRAQTLAMFPREAHVEDGATLQRWADVLVIQSTRDDASLTFNSLRCNIGAGTFVVYMCAVATTEVRLHHTGGCMVQRRDLPAEVREALTDSDLSFECAGDYYINNGIVWNKPSAYANPYASKHAAALAQLCY
jgi:hypothetical protein